MICKKSVLCLLSFYALSTTSLMCINAIEEKRPASKNSVESESFYVIDMQASDPNLDNCRIFEDVRHLELLESNIINKQLAGSDWKLHETKKDETGSEIRIYRKIICLPSSIDFLTTEKIWDLTWKLLKWDEATQTNSIPNHVGAIKDLINESYKQHCMVSMVKVLRALEILECNKLVGIFKAEIESRRKSDKKFAYTWDAAAKNYEFQHSAPIQTKSAETTSIICKQEHCIPGCHAVWSQDGHFLAISQQKLPSDFTTSILNTKTHTFEKSFDGLAVSLSHDGTKLATMCFDNLKEAGKTTAPIKIYDTTRKCELHTFSGHFAQFFNNGKEIAIVDRGTVKTYDTTRWKNTTPWFMPYFFYGKFSPDGTKFFTAITCKLFDIYNFTTKKSFRCQGAAGGFSSNNQAAATIRQGYRTGVTNTYETQTGTQTGEFVGCFAAFSTDAQRVAIVTGIISSTSIYDIETGKKLYTVSGELQQFMPGNDSYALILDKKMVCLRNCVTGEDVLKTHATAGMFSPDGTHLYLLENGTITIYAISKK